MSERVEIISDEKQWEDFVLGLAPATFLHSWKWGEQYRISGSKVFRLGIFSDNELRGVGLFIFIGAKRGSFLLCPHGPLLKKGYEKHLPALLEESTRLAQKEGCDFVRVCPLLPDTVENQKVLKKLGFRAAPIHMHPELAWILDISKSEEELLAEMRRTTRYLIKKSEKDGLIITSSTDPKDIDRFWPVYDETVKRQNFTPFSKSYLAREFALFAKDNQAAFFFAEYEGKTVAAAIIIFYGNSGFYHHSGSILNNKINASYLLQWRVIQEAKKRGCHFYNFWGIAPEDRPKHPWSGLSLFKKGFGGFAEAYVHAQDKPLSWKYGLNFAVESIRRKKRGL